MNNKGADQTAQMQSDQRLYCSHMAKADFVMAWLINQSHVFSLKKKQQHSMIVFPAHFIRYPGNKDFLNFLLV